MGEIFSPFISEKEYKLARRNNSQLVLFLTLSVTLNTSRLPKQKAWWRFVLLMYFPSYILVFGVCSSPSVRKQALLYHFAEWLLGLLAGNRIHFRGFE